MVELEGVREKGAIASSRAAAIYGLDILAEGIQVRILSDPCVNSVKFLFHSFRLMCWPICLTAYLLVMFLLPFFVKGLRQKAISHLGLEPVFCHFVFALEYAIGLDSVK